jgi:hypothetical protein
MMPVPFRLYNGRPTLGTPEADRILADVVANAKRLAADVGVPAHVYVSELNGLLSVHLKVPPRPYLEVEPGGRVVWRPVVEPAEAARRR